MAIGLELVNVLTLAGVAVIVGIFLNSRNTVGALNALANLFIGSFNAATSTIR
jgi:hypothetical protein